MLRAILRKLSRSVLTLRRGGRRVLVSDAADYITEQVLFVDGGVSAKDHFPLE
jgi:hypothetical protein